MTSRRPSYLKVSNRAATDTSHVYFLRRGFRSAAGLIFDIPGQEHVRTRDGGEGEGGGGGGCAVVGGDDVLVPRAAYGRWQTWRHVR